MTDTAKVKRYHGSYPCLMLESEHGGWVNASDFDRLVAERDALKATLKRYGRHESTCITFTSMDRDRKCICGYSAAVEGK